MEKQLNENVLPDDYPVHLWYAYVCDGKVTISPVSGTVKTLKAAVKCSEVTSCDLSGRGLM